MKRILVIGSCGQIGTELVLNLRDKYGTNNVYASDILENCPEKLYPGPYVKMDILEKEMVRSFIISEKISEVYLLAALLSAKAEERPEYAWKLNMDGLFTILDLAKEGYLRKIFWPSSIAVFGKTTPKFNTPQFTIMEPSTVYGISKQVGERWCEYYYAKYDVDVRSIRYPGLISYTSLPGGGTTDYAVDMFYQAKLGNDFTCFLSDDTALPMMYMDDAIRATLELMNAPKENIKIRSSYNLSGISFTPKDIFEEIQKYIPDFRITFMPDFRQKIADTWPSSIDDISARSDWGWKERYNLEMLVKKMLDNVDVSILSSVS
ncbi:MAG: NAD-dependent epimerase [Crocinitomicaceae bacterium]|nr:NAD-dependent epimerase [Crocinitomicaceae bacterium]|tara:strand:+ start:59779 stop:60738 length:960 start_codon:yes stop_codon:yes gene_type:complete